MNNNSRKAKSRYLQNIVKDKVIKLFKLSPGAIRTSNTGESGEDLKLLSLTAKRVFNYSTECKNSEQHIGLYKHFKQAKGHNHREPLLVVKKNREPALAIITLDHFFDLIERDD
jgi:hypothetical protein|tara:strand:- start:762 stop:1103 length:342 start_codon:yes stop_codon:yes gene_type:complete